MLKRTLFLLSLCLLAALSFAQSTTENDRPIIGLLTMPSDYPSNYSPSQYSYVRAGYVKWIESGGARVTPIQWNLATASLTQILSKLNGVVIPGGYTALTQTSGGTTSDSPFLAACRIVVNYAINQTNSGITYPVYGIDSGMLAIALIIANDYTIVTPFNQANSLATLQFTSSASTSKMYTLFPQYLTSYAQSNPIFWFNHTLGVTPSTFSANANLNSYFNVLSQTLDNSGLAFVSSFEGKTKPIYGVQFHPEKNAYEWDSTTYDHEYKAVQAGQLLVNHLIDDSRSNMNVFPYSTIEDACLIYNSNTTMLPNIFAPMYFFPNSATFCMTSSTARNLDVFDKIRDWVDD